VPSADVDVLVIGGGAAGLSTAAALARRGVRAIVLEQDREIGARWAGRYERLHLHTVRRYSGLAYHPLPRELPRYVSKDEFAEYLRGYAERFHLDVRLGERVEKVVPAASGWSVVTANGAWRSKVVVLATGAHDRPVLPAWPGLDGFQGRLLHSSEYRSGREFANLDVLVVGLGNSGAEIAADLVEQGAGRTAVAVRKTPPITPRELMAVPVQLFGIALARLPARLVDRVGTVLRRIGTGDLTPYGLGSADWGPFVTQRPPLIDVGFLEHLKRGHIEVLPAVSGFTSSGVIFADGRTERFDVVVAATGFRHALSELLDLPDPVASIYPGLYLIGYRDSIRGALFEIDRDSRRVAQSIAEFLAADRELTGSPA
jgi:putative flavoprotein involved in K+ transport